LRNSNTIRSRLVFAVLAASLFADTAYGLDPNRSLAQYVVDRWGAERGLASGPVYSLAQTSDGYLWIGAEGGLVRFDGLTFELSGLPTPQTISPASTAVMSLMADEKNGLWVRLRGLQLLYRGPPRFEDLIRDLQPPATGVTAMLRMGADPHNGGLLFATPWSGMKLWRENKLQLVVNANVLPRSPVVALAATTVDDLWLGTRDNGLLRVHAGDIIPVKKGLPSLAIHSLLAGSNGELLVGTENGIVVWNGSGITTGDAFPAVGNVPALAMIRDRDGNIWVAAGAHGLIRIDSRGTSTLPSSPTNPVNTVWEDREGNIWAGVGDNIERLRDSVFATYTGSEGLPSLSGGPVFADSRDRAWFAPGDGGLYYVDQGTARRVAVPGLNRDVVYSIAGRSDRGEAELWIGRQNGGLTHLRQSARGLAATTYTQADGLAQDHVFAVSLGRDGAVWAGTLSGGASHFANGKFTNYRTADGLASNTIASILETADGAVWFATPQGLSTLSNGAWRSYTTQDGLPSENVNCLLEDSTRTLWVGTLNGLARKTAGQFLAPSGLPPALRQQILGMAEDPNGSLWITTAGHVVSVNRARLMAASPAHPLQANDYREYQLMDGLQSLEGTKRDRSVVSDAHGRIWMSMARGLSVVDTNRLAERSVPAMVHISAISSDGNTLGLAEQVRVPAGSRRVTLEYAGLCLSIPERTRFRYRLDGADHDWSEPSAARQVIYSNLAPGGYRFRVIASNVDGAFNSAEAAIVFDVEPLLWQRWSVRAAAAAILTCALILMVRLRMQSVARQLNLRFEERLSERARIAGELHDTLLQTVQASKMIADNARLDHASDPARLRAAVEDISAWLEQAITEGRSALNALRNPAVRKNDLVDAFQRAADISQVTASMSFVLSTEGTEQELHPLVRDEVYRIGCEAMRNAAQHSGGTHLEINIRYARHFTISIKDDGRGIASDVVAEGKPGHFGLRGMQERAIRIHGTLKVLSRPQAGTEVELTVPANVIFAQSRGEKASWLERFRRYGKGRSKP
jgi:signal transduction histidine kinase